jgi:hypothetical protein
VLRVNTRSRRISGNRVPAPIAWHRGSVQHRGRIRVRNRTRGLSRGRNGVRPGSNRGVAPLLRGQRLRFAGHLRGATEDPAVDHVGQRDPTQEQGDLAAELVPEVMRLTSLSGPP